MYTGGLVQQMDLLLSIKDLFTNTWDKVKMGRKLVHKKHNKIFQETIY